MNQASESLWDEAWMRTGGELQLRSWLLSTPQPDEAKLENERRNNELLFYRTIIAAKCETALLVSQKNYKSITPSRTG